MPLAHPRAARAARQRRQESDISPEEQPMEMETLRDLYVGELKDLYSAENQLVKALPKMAKAASHPELKRAFETHLRQTERQVERLDRIFKELDTSPRGKKCVGMEGLIKEGQELIKEKPDPDVLNAGLISKAQHVEHYEIAGYGTVRTYAQQLGLERQAQLLQQTLDEEAEADKLLTQIAESSVNLEAEVGGEREVSRSAVAEGGARGRGTRKRATGGAEAEAR
jgi:ferritin-like metal-binding protein YciE